MTNKYVVGAYITGAIAFGLFVLYHFSAGDRSLSLFVPIGALLVMVLYPSVFRSQVRQYHDYVGANPATTRLERHSKVLKLIGVVFLMVAGVVFLMIVPNASKAPMSTGMAAVLWGIALLATIGLVLVLYRTIVRTVTMIRAARGTKR